MARTSRTPAQPEESILSSKALAEAVAAPIRLHLERWSADFEARMMGEIESRIDELVKAKVKEARR